MINKKFLLSELDITTRTIEIKNLISKFELFKNNNNIKNATNNKNKGARVQIIFPSA